MMFRLPIKLCSVALLCSNFTFYNFDSVDEIFLKCKYLQSCFFTPIPRSYTSSPLGGVARNYFSYYYLPGCARSTQFIVSGSIYSYRLCPRREEKTTWSELDSNPVDNFSYPQATALTTRPCLLGHIFTELEICTKCGWTSVNRVNK